MNASNADVQVLELPGKTTVWRTTGLQPRRIKLPYLGRLSRWRMLVILILGIPLTLLMAISYPVLLFVAVSKFGKAPLDLIKALLALVICPPLLMVLGEAVLVAFRGVFHRSYHVGFDAERFWHFQLSGPVAFSSIKRLDVLYAGGDPIFLRITTDQPIPLAFASPFNRRRPSRRKGGAPCFTFSSGMLAGDKVLLIDAIGHLVEVNGGVVARKSVLSLWFEFLVPWL